MGQLGYAAWIEHRSVPYRGRERERKERGRGKGEREGGRVGGREGGREGERERVHVEVRVHGRGVCSMGPYKSTFSTIVHNPLHSVGQINEAL
jgi:hypothetical protein